MGRAPIDKEGSGGRGGVTGRERGRLQQALVDELDGQGLRLAYQDQGSARLAFSLTRPLYLILLIQFNCVRNIHFRNVVFTDPLKAIYIKTDPGDGKMQRPGLGVCAP